MSRSEIFDQVYELVSQIPMGKVSTYGDIAKIVGINPRYVGYILHNNPTPGKVPCHRVVSSQGKVAKTFAFGGGSSQQNLLEVEGVVFIGGKLSLMKYHHNF